MGVGLIRKVLFVSTGGVVAPNSKKQRVAKQTLAAIQGRDDEDAELIGTRRQALGLTGASSAGDQPGVHRPRVG